MFGPLSSTGGMLALLKAGATPGPVFRANRIGTGRRNVMSIARAVRRAEARGYDIAKIGAKTQARMAKAQAATAGAR